MRKKRSRRAVLITGASSGIGAMTALEFARAGWRVLAQYRSSDEKARGLQQEIEAAGGECILVKADLETRPGIGRLMRAGEAHAVDSLVNNAGTYRAGVHFSALGLDDLIATFTVNAFAPTLLACRFFRHMQERGFGRIVNVSSIAAKYGGSANSLHYGSSKRALEGLTKTLAKAGAEHNILVNTVRPGVIDTEFHKKFPKDMTARIAMIPVKRMGRAEDVAGIIYYLGSERNDFITNQTIAVSGGE